MEVDRWSGRRANALHKAYRQVNPDVSDEAFAQNVLGIAPRTLYNWQRDPDSTPRPATQRLLKAFFSTASQEVKDQFWQILRATVTPSPPPASSEPLP